MDPLPDHMLQTCYDTRHTYDTPAAHATLHTYANTTCAQLGACMGACMGAEVHLLSADQDTGELDSGSWPGHDDDNSTSPHLEALLNHHREVLVGGARVAPARLLQEGGERSEQPRELVRQRASRSVVSVLESCGRIGSPGTGLAGRAERSSAAAAPSCARTACPARSQTRPP